MGNANQKNNLELKTIILPLKTLQEKENYLLGEKKVVHTTYTALKKKNVILNANIPKNDLKTLNFDIILYKKTKAIVIEAKILDCPIHPEHVTFLVDDLKQFGLYDILEVEYFALPYLTFAVYPLIQMLQSSFPSALQK